MKQNILNEVNEIRQKMGLVSEQSLWEKIKNFFPTLDVKKDKETNKTTNFCGPNCQDELNVINQTPFNLPNCFDFAMKNSKFPGGNPNPGDVKQFNMENISMVLKAANSSLPPDIKQFSGLVFFDSNKKPFCKVSSIREIEYDYPMGWEPEPEVGEPEVPTK